MTELRKVRVRFAPSPTGPLHIGGVRTALYNYLFARQHGGEFIFRIEDTDSGRFVPGAEEYIIESFKWLGIKFDEGVSFGGNHGPYRQSERRDIYKKYVQQLLDSGKAYIAFDTPEELDAKRAEIENFQYDASTRMQMRNSLVMPKEEVDALIAEGQQYVVRFLIEPGRDVIVDDIIRGEVRINSSILDDKVLYKSADELPTYHLANIVDDHLMEVTHVIRGEEWLPSAPLHVLLYEAFGWADTMPRFAHLPLLLKPIGNGKLSKRDGDKLGFPVFPLEWHDPKSGEVSSGYREKGYLPEAVVNFLALLGWNPGNDQEVMSLDEMVQLFDLSKCSKNGAKFDYIKAAWFNHQYLLKQTDQAWVPSFDKVLREQGIEATPEQEAEVVRMMKQKVIEYTDGQGQKHKRNISFVSDLWPLTRFFFVAPESFDTEDKFIRKNWKEGTAAEMQQLADVLATVDDFSVEGQKAVIDVWSAETGIKPWNAWRICLVGEGQGPDMYELAAFLGKDETLRRMSYAIEKLG
ncbi:MAG: glutamate--tRNA ligase [Bacteroidaceae bacterium]|jgi:glutamyl-tRNA synthetase|nr:glutamate--tRNA ligase [Bacteroidaceae bacterium]